MSCIISLWNLLALDSIAPQVPFLTSLDPAALFSLAAAEDSTSSCSHGQEEEVWWVWKGNLSYFAFISSSFPSLFGLSHLYASSTWPVVLSQQSWVDLSSLILETKKFSWGSFRRNWSIISGGAEFIEKFHHRCVATSSLWYFLKCCLICRDSFFAFEILSPNYSRTPFWHLLMLTARTSRGMR